MLYPVKMWFHHVLMANSAVGRSCLKILGSMKPQGHAGNPTVSPTSDEQSMTWVTMLKPHIQKSAAEHGMVSHLLNSNQEIPSSLVRLFSKSLSYCSVVQLHHVVDSQKSGNQTPHDSAENDPNKANNCLKLAPWSPSSIWWRRWNGQGLGMMSETNLTWKIHWPWRSTATFMCRFGVCSCSHSTELRHGSEDVFFNVNTTSTLELT